MTEQSADKETAPFGRGRFMTLAVVTEFGLLALAVLLAFVFGTPFWKQVFIGPRDVALSIAVTVPLTIVVILLAETSWAGLQQLRKDLALVVELFKECTVIDLFVVSALAGLGEEALFRGVLQPYLAEYTGALISLAVISFVFGALHAISFVYFVFATLIGLFLGGLFLWSGNLAIPMMVHGLYDFLALYYGSRIWKANKRT